MAHSRGFTIVELVVVMVVMAILLALGVVALSGSQANARNTQRAADIETIAKGLESRYTKGNPLATATYITKGTYPSVNEILHAENQSISTITPNLAGAVYIEQLLPGTTRANFYPPGTSDPITGTFKVVCATTCTVENATNINAALGSTSNVYVYEPIAADNTLCINTACVRYNLYYKPENAGTYAARVSKHQ